MTWGYELCLVALDRLGGIAAVTFAHALAAALATALALLTYRLLARGPATLPPVAIALGLFALSISDHRFRDRPEVLTYLFGAAMIYLLVRNGVRRDRWIWCVPLIQVLWTNSHGLFLFGPLIVSLFVLPQLRLRTERSRSLWLIALTLSACFVNPYGWKGALFPFHLLQVLRDPFYSTAILEARGPFTEPRWGLAARNLCLWSALLFPACLAVARKQPAWLVLSAGLFYAATAASRNIPLLTAWTLPLVAATWDQLVGKLLDLRSRQSLRRALASAGALLVLAAIVSIPTNLYRLGSKIRFGLDVKPHFFPDGALKFLSDRRFTGRIYADIAVSDYFLFNLPGYRPYIDGRFAELYTPEHSRHAFEILEHPHLINLEAKRWDIAAVVVSPQTRASRAFIMAESSDPGWILAYFDESSAVFLRRDEFGASTPAPSTTYQSRERTLWEEADAHLRTGPSTFVQRLNWFRESDIFRPLDDLASMGSYVGLNTASARTLDALVAKEPELTSAWADLCLVDYLVPQRRAKGVSDCHQAMIRGVPPAAPEMVLGLIALKNHHPDAAIRHFTVQIKTDPDSYPAHFGLAQSLVVAGDLKRAEAELRAVIRRWPEDAEPWVSLASIVADRDRAQAIALLDKASRYSQDQIIAEKRKELLGRLPTAAK